MDLNNLRIIDECTKKNYKMESQTLSSLIKCDKSFKIKYRENICAAQLNTKLKSLPEHSFLLHNLFIVVLILASEIS